MFNPQQFEEVYDFATKGDHDAFVMDFTGGEKENRIRRNFNERILV
jgi:hypothetical protein